MKQQLICASVMALAGVLTVGCSDDDDGGGSSGTGATGGSMAMGGTGGSGAMGGTDSTGGTATGGTDATGGTGAAAGTGGTGGGNSIVDIAAGDPQFSTLVAAVTKAGLADALGQDGLTVFAPTNDAFAALLAQVGASSLDDLSVEQLTPILLYHVLGSEVDAAAATGVAQSGDPTAMTLGGTIELAEGGTGVGLVVDPDGANANVTAADIQADNGIIHVVDAVLLPSITDVVVSDDTSFSSLEAAVVGADLAGTLDDDTAELTVFAPTNDAFAGLVTALSGNASTGITALTDFTAEQLTPVLLYHVVDSVVPSNMVSDGPVTTLGGTAMIDTSSGVMVDSANVVITDIYTSNGVIHVVDSVLLPDIVDVVTTDPDLSTLATVVTTLDSDVNPSPDLVGTLTGAGPLTLLAPVNDGFATLLSANNAADLGELATAVGGLDQLVPVVAYHVAPAAAYAADVVAADGSTITTSDTVTVTVNGGEVTLNQGVSSVAGTNDSKVIVTNIFTANGVIHKVDKVIAPAP